MFVPESGSVHPMPVRRNALPPEKAETELNASIAEAAIRVKGFMSLMARIATFICSNKLRACSILPDSTVGNANSLAARGHTGQKGVNGFVNLCFWAERRLCVSGI